MATLPVGKMIATPKVPLRPPGDSTAYPASTEFVNAATGYAVRPEQYGAVGDGVTDDTAAIVSALAAGNYIVFSGAYRCSSTITIPASATLEGVAFAPGMAGSEIKGSRLIFDATVTPCIHIAQSASNAISCCLKNISITRSGGAPVSTTVGIQVDGGYNHTFHDVLSHNHGICWQFNINGTSGIAAHLSNCHSYSAVDAHCDINGWPELTWINSRFGSNGVNVEYAATTYVRCRGGTVGGGSGPNTVKFIGCQFNQGDAVNCPSYFWQFVDMASGNTSNIIYHVTDCHIETVRTAFFYSDATWDVLTRLVLTSCAFYGVTPSTVEAFALNAATSISGMSIVGCDWDCKFTLAQPAILDLSIFGGLITRDYSITAGGSQVCTATIVGVEHAGNIAYAGDWLGLTSVGETIETGFTKTFTVTATGNVHVDSLPYSQGTWTPQLLINNSAVGITQTTTYGLFQVNGKLVTCTFNIVLSSKGAGAGGVTVRGLPYTALNTGAPGGGVVHYIDTANALPGVLALNVIANSADVAIFTVGATGVGQLQDTNLNNTTAIQGTFTYVIR